MWLVNLEVNPVYAYKTTIANITRITVTPTDLELIELVRRQDTIGTRMNQNDLRHICPSWQALQQSTTTTFDKFLCRIQDQMRLCRLDNSSSKRIVQSKDGLGMPSVMSQHLSYQEDSTLMHRPQV